MSAGSYPHLDRQIFNPCKISLYLAAALPGGWIRPGQSNGYPDDGSVQYNQVMEALVSLMNDQISDLLIAKLSQQTAQTSTITQLLSFDDHLLRRFGLLELVRKEPEEPLELSVRSVADEFWFLLEGKIKCTARDVRLGSPSEGVEVTFTLSEPSRIMVPFGVAFGWISTDPGSLMLRCTTHSDGDHPDDRVIPIKGRE